VNKKVRLNIRKLLEHEAKKIKKIKGRAKDESCDERGDGGGDGEGEMSDREAE
jgi:hypothetical protein